LKKTGARLRSNVKKNMFFKKEKKEIKISEADKGGFEFQLDLRTHIVDNLYIIKLPVKATDICSQRLK
jgi:hypothetical protein